MIKNPIQDAIEELIDEEIANVDKILSKEAENTLQDLIALSPIKTGDYAKSWYIKKYKHPIYKINTYIITNEKKYLTRFLEYGTATRNKPIPHISIARKNLIKRLKF